MRPLLIVLDEPTSDLDPVNCDRIERLIVDLKTRFGMSVVIATHDLDLAARIADRICLVRDGSVFSEGSPVDIFYNTALIREAGLKIPSVISIYLKYCEEKGMEPTKRPINDLELIAILKEH